MEPTPPEHSPAGTPLTAVAGITEALATRLHSHWLRSAEDVLAASASPATASALQQFLGLDQAAFARLIANLRAAVPAETLARLSRPPGLPGGLGLRLPEDLPPSGSQENR